MNLLNYRCGSNLCCIVLLLGNWHRESMRRLTSEASCYCEPTLLSWNLHLVKDLFTEPSTWIGVSSSTFKATKSSLQNKFLGVVESGAAFSESPSLCHPHTCKNQRMDGRATSQRSTLLCQWILHLKSIYDMAFHFLKECFLQILFGPDCVLTSGSVVVDPHPVLPGEEWTTRFCLFRPFLCVAELSFHFGFWRKISGLTRRDWPHSENWSWKGKDTSIPLQKNVAGKNKMFQQTGGSVYFPKQSIEWA